VTALARDGALTRVVTPDATLRARFVVNAAGLAAGRVSRMLGGEPLDVWPRKGQYAVLDREFGQRLRSIVFSVHLPDTKGVNVVPTTHGTCLLGPTAHDHDDPGDRATDGETIAGLQASAARLVPAAAGAAAIKVFAANRPASDEPCRLRLDNRVGTLLHATNRSTGVSTAPAVAELALELLRGAGLDTADRSDAVRALPAVPQLRTAPEPERLAAADPGYGQVVCACEHVSAAEIAAALSGPLAARSVDALRKRTGAGYGRCQGSICLAGLTFLCAMANGDGPADARLTAAGTVGA
jgi:glycerol-3-phosphate dehydrogenase